MTCLKVIIYFFLLSEFLLFVCTLLLHVYVRFCCVVLSVTSSVCTFGVLFHVGPVLLSV